MRRFLISISLVISFLTFLVLSAWLFFLFTPVVTHPGGLRYQVSVGTSFANFTQDLKQQGLIKYPAFFKLLAQLRGSTQQLKAGIYLLPQGTTPLQLLDQVTTGKGLLYHSFTLVPGWTFQQLREALHQAEGLQHSLENMSDLELMKFLGSPSTLPEGEFYPDTYYYLDGSNDLALLKRAFKRMQMKAEEAWFTRDVRLPFKTLYEALIMASLIEKETHLSAERPVIAGVLLNRLQKNMLLQCDPTVIYGVNQIRLKASTTLSKQDLKENTPYNTYVHKGLPPTPIAMPSLDSLHASLHPVWHDYLYFVANAAGGHQFSTTLEEHHLAVMIARHQLQGFYAEFLISAYLLQQFSKLKLGFDALIIPTMSSLSAKSRLAHKKS